MPKLHSLILFMYCFLGIVLLADAQPRRKRVFTYAGVEVGAKFEQYGVLDKGNSVYTKLFFNRPFLGIKLEQELSQITMLGIGFYQTTYTTNFRFKGDQSYNAYDVLKTTHIPIRLLWKIPLSYGIPDVRLTPSLGINAVINRSYGKNESVRGRILPNFANFFTGTINKSIQKTYPLLEAGASVDIVFLDGWMLCLGANYYKGISRLVDVNIRYVIENKPNTAQVFSDGDFFSINLSAKYPISRFWKNPRWWEADKKKMKKRY
jgi:hypothetical protein